ncbi:Putative uncharacterized protein [Mycobacterium tuberculosis variant bovis]|nr:Putative uncharacterized protein [Mycobacterium tuberculosis variant bovis]CEJ34302.1 Putative uncharacterized protein [Mycobacterium tuberculosis variant bovis]
MLGGHRDQCRVAATQHSLQGRQQQRGSRTGRDVQRTQDGYACSSRSRTSSSGHPWAANRARTRSTSSGDGNSSVKWVITTPMSIWSKSPSRISSLATALTSSWLSRRQSRASTAKESVGGMPSGYPARNHATIEVRNRFTPLYLPVGAVAKPYVAAICDSTWVWRPGRPSRCDAR